MAVIRSSASDRVVRDAVVLDLGDLRRQGDELVAQARAKAEQIVKEAQAERARLLTNAAEEGRTKGHAQGHEKGLVEGREQGRRESLDVSKATIEALLKAWSAALAEFERVRDDLQQSGRRGVVELAVAIGEKVARRAIEHNPAAVEAQLEAAVGLVLKSSRLIVAAHPDDLEAAEACLPELVARLGLSTSVQVIGDDSLTRGSCVVRTDKGEIDATTDTQLQRICEALLPDRRLSRGGGSPDEPGTAGRDAASGGES